MLLLYDFIIFLLPYTLTGVACTYGHFDPDVESRDYHVTRSRDYHVIRQNRNSDVHL